MTEKSDLDADMFAAVGMRAVRERQRPMSINNEWTYYDKPELTLGENVKQLAGIAVELPKVVAVVAYAHAMGFIDKIKDKID